MWVIEVQVKHRFRIPKSEADKYRQAEDDPVVGALRAAMRQFWDNEITHAKDVRQVTITKEEDVV